MEGILWKWTNYWNGWQTRWFVLENGVLSYYKSQDEVNQGCKGSLKVQACQINVNPIDNTRLDLVIPGEQHLYLRAATSQERQEWLVALGTAKAGTHYKVKDHADSNPDKLRTKKSELKLYCDLLMQQVHVVKVCAQSKSGPNVEEMNEATRLLGATCDTFINTLEECMILSDANSTHQPPGKTDSSLNITNANPPNKRKLSQKTVIKSSNI